MDIITANLGGSGSHWLPHALLAQNQVLHGMRSRFSGGASETDTTQLIILLSVLAVIAVGLWLGSRVMAQREGQVFDSSRKLFRDLCRVHELDWRQRRCLRLLARARHLDSPAQLFLDPAAFDVSRLPAGGRQDGAQWERLRRTIHGGATGAPDGTGKAR